MVPQNVLCANAPFGPRVVLVGIGTGSGSQVAYRRGAVVILLAVGERVSKTQALVQRTFER